MGGFLEKHEFLNYVQRVIRHANDNEYRLSVLSVGKEIKDFYHIECLGEKNKGKIICLYEENDPFGVGFFAFYRYWIETCYLCELYGFVPEIGWGEDFPYSENGKEINGHKEYFCHFFQQYSKISLSEAKESFAVIKTTYWMREKARRMLYDREIESLGYTWDEDYFKKMAAISRKYVHMNPLLEKSITTDIEHLLHEKKTVAVHARIKVFQKGINNHPIASDVGEYIKKAKEALDIGFEQIFLATEEADTVELFKREFGNTVVFYEDVLRTIEGNVIFSEARRENHKYLLGYEVLRDMHTIAKCEGVIAGLSQVSICAQITKYEYGEDYCFKCIFDNGVYSSKYNVQDDYKKFKKENKIW